MDDRARGRAMTAPDLRPERAVGERPEVRDVQDGAVRLFSYGGRTTYAATIVESATAAERPAHGNGQRTDTASTPLFDALYAERYGPR